MTNLETITAERNAAIEELLIMAARACTPSGCLPSPPSELRDFAHLIGYSLRSAQYFANYLRACAIDGPLSERDFHDSIRQARRDTSLFHVGELPAPGDYVQPEPAQPAAPEPAPTWYSANGEVAAYEHATLAWDRGHSGPVFLQMRLRTPSRKSTWLVTKSTPGPTAYSSVNHGTIPGPGTLRAVKLPDPPAPEPERGTVEEPSPRGHLYLAPFRACVYPKGGPDGLAFWVKSIAASAEQAAFYSAQCWDCTEGGAWVRVMFGDELDPSLWRVTRRGIYSYS